MWFMPEIDLSGIWAGDTEKSAECVTDRDHKWCEKPLFNSSYWKCQKCSKEMEFDEIKEHHAIVSRCSASALPWE